MTKTAKLWCETCEGLGTVDNTLGGGGNLSATRADPCPDCDGGGYIEVSREVVITDAMVNAALVGALQGVKGSW